MSFREICSWYAFSRWQSCEDVSKPLHKNDSKETYRKAGEKPHNFSCFLSVFSRIFPLRGKWIFHFYFLAQRFVAATGKINSPGGLFLIKSLSQHWSHLVFLDMPTANPFPNQITLIPWFFVQLRSVLLNCTSPTGFWTAYLELEEKKTKSIKKSVTRGRGKEEFNNFH